MMRMWLRGIVVLFLSMIAAAPVHAEHRHSNDEFGLSVAFPSTPNAGQVCEDLSGDHLHGFYAWYGGGRGCRRHDPPLSGVTAIGIYASYNALEARTPAEALADQCNVALASSIKKKIKALSFPGYLSFACAGKQKDGAIAVSVVTLAGPWDSEEVPGTRIRSIEYEAFLVVNRPEDIVGRLPLFRAFLRGVRIRARR